MSEDLLVDGYDYNPHTCMIEVPYNDYWDMKNKCKENKQLKSQLQQKENIIKELNEKIEDDKMIIEGNWGCIDNLRKDYNLQKNIIKEVREYIKKASYLQGNKILEEKEILKILDKE